jgi:hypothetical protein
LTRDSNGAVAMPWKTRAAMKLAYRALVWEAPPHALVTANNNVPPTNRCRLPQMRPVGTKIKADRPTPRRYHPVSSAICANFLEKSSDSGSVLAARIGPSDVAKMAVRDRMKVMRSRFHRGQLRGSLGSSDGWGTRMMGTGPLVSYLRPSTRSAAY